MATISRVSPFMATCERPSSSSGLSRNQEVTGYWFVVLVGMLELAVLILGVSLVVPVTAPTGVEHVASQFR
jgi:hypothetical protein